MARLSNLNQKLQNQQRPSAGKVVLKAGAGLAGAGFRVLTNAIHNEVPGLDMFTSPLAGFAGDLYKGMFSKPETQRIRAGRGKPGVIGALGTIAETNEKILKSTAKTAKNTDDIKATSFKAWVEQNQARNEAKAREYREKFRRQVKEGHEGDTKYGDKMGKAVEENGASIAESIKKAFHEGILLPIVEGLLELGGSILGIFGIVKGGKSASSVLGKIAKAPFNLIGAIGKGVGGKAHELIGDAMKAASRKKVLGEVKTEMEALRKAQKEYAQHMKRKMVTQAELERRKRAFEDFSSEETKARFLNKNTYQEMKDRLEERYKRYARDYKRKFSRVGPNGEKVDTILDRINQRMNDHLAKVEHIEKFPERVADKFEKVKHFFTGDKSLLSADGTIGELKGASNLDKLKVLLKSKGVMGSAKGIGNFLKMPGTRALGLLSPANLILFPIIAGVTEGFMTALNNPKEWSRLKQTFKDRGLKGIVSDELGGKGNTIVENGIKGAVSSLWGYIKFLFWDWWNDIIDGVLYIWNGPQGMKEFEDWKEKLGDKLTPNWVKKLQTKWDNWGKNPPVDAQTTNLVAQQKANEALKDAKENQKASSNPPPLIQNNMTTNNNSSVQINSGISARSNNPFMETYRYITSSP